MNRIRAIRDYFRARRAMYRCLVLYLKARDAHGRSRERLNEARYYAGVMRRARVTMRTGRPFTERDERGQVYAKIRQWHQSAGVEA